MKSHWKPDLSVFFVELPPTKFNNVGKRNYTGYYLMSILASKNAQMANYTED